MRALLVVMLLSESIAFASPPVQRLTPIRVPTRAAMEVPQRGPSASELADLYATVGRELSALETRRGTFAAIDLWPRYRWIRINDALQSLPKRIEGYDVLDKLRREIAATR
jgi:hypothetical protein